MKIYFKPLVRLFLFPLLVLGLPIQTIAAQQSIDAVIAIVEEDILTRRELDERKRLILAEFSQSNRTPPDEKILHRQVLETMIRDSILLQEAKNRGIEITDGQLNQTMQKIARDNKKNLTEFRQLLIAKGIDYEKYRETIRKDLILNSLRRQYTARSATVTEEEVDDFLNRNDDGSIEYEYKIAHILIALPDAATPAQVSDAQSSVADLLDKLDNGASFEQLANEFSSGSNALQGGDLGWRKKAEIPSLFTDAVLPMKPGEYAGPFRSASGYHIVYLSDRKDVEQVLSKQVRSRHILLKSNELTSEDEVESRLIEFRQRILDGEDFYRLARLYSVDYASGIEGGDIGWKGKGETVKEYEDVSNRLEIGEISQPFRTQFGWHIVEVTGRRTIDETSESRRDKIYSQLLQQKQREIFTIWQQRLRDEAYVVFPDAS